MHEPCPACGRESIYYIPADNHWYTPYYACSYCSWWETARKHEKETA